MLLIHLRLILPDFLLMLIKVHNQNSKLLGFNKIVLKLITFDTDDKK